MVKGYFHTILLLYGEHRSHNIHYLMSYFKTLPQQAVMLVILCRVHQEVMVNRCYYLEARLCKQVSWSNILFRCCQFCSISVVLNTIDRNKLQTGEVCLSTSENVRVQPKPCFFLKQLKNKNKIKTVNVNFKKSKKKNHQHHFVDILCQFILSGQTLKWT